MQILSFTQKASKLVLASMFSFSLLASSFIPNTADAATLYTDSSSSSHYKAIRPGELEYIKNLIDTEGYKEIRRYESKRPLATDVFYAASKVELKTYDDVAAKVYGSETIDGSNNLFVYNVDKNATTVSSMILQKSNEMRFTLSYYTYDVASFLIYKDGVYFGEFAHLTAPQADEQVSEEVNPVEEEVNVEPVQEEPIVNEEVVTTEPVQEEATDEDIVATEPVEPVQEEVAVPDNTNQENGVVLEPVILSFENVTGGGKLTSKDAPEANKQFGFNIKNKHDAVEVNLEYHDKIQGKSNKNKSSIQVHINGVASNVKEVKDFEGNIIGIEFDAIASVKELTPNNEKKIAKVHVFVSDNSIDTKGKFRLTIIDGDADLVGYSSGENTVTHGNIKIR